MNTVVIAFLIIAATTPSGDDAARVETLQRQLLAPCCWSETVNVHRSEVALRMRLEIQEMVAAGRSDREILDHYISEYGKRVLVEPEGDLSIWIHTVPVVAVILGLVIVALVIRRLAKPPLPSSP